MLLAESKRAKAFFFSVGKIGSAEGRTPSKKACINKSQVLLRVGNYYRRFSLDFDV